MTLAHCPDTLLLMKRTDITVKDQFHLKVLSSVVITTFFTYCSSPSCKLVPTSDISFHLIYLLLFFFSQDSYKII